MALKISIKKCLGGGGGGGNVEGLKMMNKRVERGVENLIQNSWVAFKMLI